MKLRATATPTDAPMPAEPPAPTDTAAATTTAVISESLAALRVTSARLSIRLSLA